MKTSIFPVNTLSTGPTKVQFCDTGEEVIAALERWGETINLIYAGSVENLPEIYKPYIANENHPAFEDAKLNHENVIIFQWKNVE